ncbi:MAG: hypothetical protein ACMVO5_04860 [Polymorphobacter sp.]|uniref:hypothetical protein n=1 Tax=Polymorphobacter sp. TaxID=1909290 RepID=UPI003A84402F
MDIKRLTRSIERIEALDRGRFEPKVAAALQARGLAPDTAPVLAETLRDYIRTIPEMMALMTSWADQVGVASELAPLLSAAERYVRQPDDEIDDQKHGLFGLLDDVWVVGTLLANCKRAGLPLPDSFDIDQFNSFTALLIGDDVVTALSARLEAAAAVPPKPVLQPAPAAPAPAPRQIDRRLVGSWHHSSFYSSGDFHHSSTTSRHFGADGRYVEGTQSFVNMIHRNSSGDQIGQSDANSAPPRSRGRWSMIGRTLTLDADNGDSYDFTVEIHSGSMLLSQPGRDPKLWTR